MMMCSPLCALACVSAGVVISVGIVYVAARLKGVI